MKPDYSDILKATSFMKPKWFDDNGVPRFCKYEPQIVEKPFLHGSRKNYCEVFLKIACQNCGCYYDVQTFVEISDIDLEKAKTDKEYLSEIVCYGDIPRIFCCIAGYSMNSIPIRIYEFWHLDLRDLMDKKIYRIPELEVKIQTFKQYHKKNNL